MVYQIESLEYVKYEIRYRLVGDQGQEELQNL